MRHACCPTPHPMRTTLIEESEFWIRSRFVFLLRLKITSSCPARERCSAPPIFLSPNSEADGLSFLIRPPWSTMSARPGVGEARLAWVASSSSVQTFISGSKELTRWASAHDGGWTPTKSGCVNRSSSTTKVPKTTPPFAGEPNLLPCQHKAIREQPSQNVHADKDIRAWHRRDGAFDRKLPAA